MIKSLVYDGARTIQELTFEVQFKNGLTILNERTFFFTIIDGESKFELFVNDDSNEYSDVRFLLRTFNKHDTREAGKGFTLDEVIEWLSTEDCAYEVAENMYNIKEGRDNYVS